MRHPINQKRSYRSPDCSLKGRSFKKTNFELEWSGQCSVGLLAWRQLEFCIVSVLPLECCGSVKLCCGFNFKTLTRCRGERWSKRATFSFWHRFRQRHVVSRTRRTRRRPPCGHWAWRTGDISRRDLSYFWIIQPSNNGVFWVWLKWLSLNLMTKISLTLFQWNF